MGDDIISKIKDRYVEAIYKVLPPCQIGFFILMSVALNHVADRKSGSPLDFVSKVGVRDIVWFDGGRFWGSGVVWLFLAMAMVALNKLVIGYFIKKSFSHGAKKTYIENVYNSSVATAKMLGEHEDRMAVAVSIKEEIDGRLKIYCSMRLICELFFCGASYILFFSISSFFCGKVNFYWNDFFATIVLLVLWLFVHHKSIAYSISSIVPLQLMHGALTGEIVFMMGRVE